MGINFTSGQLVGYVQLLLWPFLRITGLFMAAPMFSAATIPARVKVILAASLAFIIAPLIAPGMTVEPFGTRLLLMSANQILIGVAIGLVVEIIFEALNFSGQIIATTMGLGYAMLIDPQRGTSVPVVSQFMLVLGMLLFLSFDGHLALIRVVAESFQWLPVDGSTLAPQAARGVAEWGGKIFSAGTLIALPALVALIVVNLALGVVSRAAPALNLFAVGFPVTLSVGFLIVLVGLYNLQGHFSDLLRESLQAAQALLSGSAARG